MKILYGIQGTGNGHISKAETIYPLLKKYGQVDVLVSAKNYSLKPSFPIKFHKTGISFVTKNGKIDLWQSLLCLRLYTFLKDIFTFPFFKYDLIISDFEPITAWGAKLNKLKSIQISHQASFYSEFTPRPIRKDVFAEFIIKYFSPTTTYIGLHFKSYSENISEPIIKKKLYEITVTEQSHITVYLPYLNNDILLSFFLSFTYYDFHVFAPQVKSEYRKGNVVFKPVSNEGFIESLASCYGVVCNAGFETPSEALFLGKRLLVVPLANQYEQYCNVKALKLLGVMSINCLNQYTKHTFFNWLNSKPIKIAFNCTIEQLIYSKISSLFEKELFDIDYKKTLSPLSERVE